MWREKEGVFVQTLYTTVRCGKGRCDRFSIECIPSIDEAYHINELTIDINIDALWMEYLISLEIESQQS